MNKTKNKFITNSDYFVDKHGYVWFRRDKQWEVVVENSDIVTYLKEKKMFHLGELNKISAALSAIETSSTQSKDVAIKKPGARRKTKWSQEITKIFKGRSGERITPLDIRETLLSQGVIAVDAPGNKNVIYTTLTRLVKKGVIDKIKVGVYCLKIKQESRQLEP